MQSYECCINLLIHIINPIINIGLMPHGRKFLNQSQLFLYLTQQIKDSTLSHHALLLVLIYLAGENSACCHSQKKNLHIYNCINLKQVATKYLFTFFSLVIFLVTVISLQLENVSTDHCDNKPQSPPLLVVFNLTNLNISRHKFLKSYEIFFLLQLPRFS